MATLPPHEARPSAATDRTAVELDRVTMTYGAFTAIEGLSLSIAEGSFVTLLGPSGCGKSTLLRAIAGLVAPSAGGIVIRGRRVNEVPIHKRNIGLVFQNYALFPHKTVHDNIAFGLKYRGVDRSAASERVRKVLNVVRLPGVEQKLPSELSGGMQQRVALARAIVIEPDVLLLDEPFSALDANLREEMRIELKAIQRQVGITTIFVTHDQQEALAMSDEVVVMNRGRIEQVGSPEEVYRKPGSRFVANFLGQSNILSGSVKTSDGSTALVELENGAFLNVGDSAAARPGQRVQAVVRAHRIRIGRPGGSSAFTGKIHSLSYLGGTAAYVVDAEGLRLQAINVVEDCIFREGDMVGVTIAPEDCVLLTQDGMRIS